MDHIITKIILFMRSHEKYSVTVLNFVRLLPLSHPIGVFLVYLKSPFGYTLMEIFRKRFLDNKILLFSGVQTVESQKKILKLQLTKMST